MIKAVIFDCFGVLTTDGWIAFRETYFGNKPDILEQAVTINRQVDAGLMRYDDFVHEVAGLAGISDQQARAMIESNTANNKLFEYIRDQLSPSYRIGLISNAAENWLPKLFEPWQHQLIEEPVFSFELGVVKPDPVMYEMAATRLGMLPEECVFIDDQERNITGARETGMQGIHFKDTLQTIAELEELLRA